MNQSQSQIQQSIYDSSRYNKDVSKKPHFLLLDSKQLAPSRKVPQKNYHAMDYSKTNKVVIPQSFGTSQRIEKKQSKQQQRPQTGSAPRDANFIKYYEENINLKKKHSQLSKQVQSLKNQLYEQSQVRRAANQRELAQLAAGKRSLWDTKHQSTQKTKNTGPKNADNTKISNLLQIIQDYKSKLMTAQAQVQNVRRQKHLLEQDGKLKEKKADQLMRDYKDSSGKVNTAQLQQQLRNNIRLLQIEKQRNRFNEADIKRLQTKIRTLQIRQQQLDDLRIENRSLEDRIFKLTSLPAFSEVKDKIQEQSKLKELEEKYKKINQKYNQLKNDNIKKEADFKAVSNKLIQVSSEADQLMKQNIRLKAVEKQNPIIFELSKDPQLLGRVVYEIRNGKRSKQADSQFQRQTNDKILFQKEMLANQLAGLRGKMNAMQQIWKQKQRVSMIEKQELLNSLKGERVGDSAKEQFKVMSKNGVPYTDDVSMFSQDVVNLPPATNYFDLCLGQLHLLQTMLAANFNMRSADNALILATVDFYNHNTQTTRPVQGNHCNLQSQFSFKVTEDQYFFKYLNKNSFTIEIWGSEGNKRNNMGKATIELKSLILKSRKNLAPVVSASVPIYMNKKVMGSINFVMRMRLPIFDQLQKINELEQIVSNQQSVTRKLIIQIQEGRGFPQSSNTFVYYNFRLQDLYTKTFKGSTPAWNYYKTVELKYNNDLKNYLRKNDLEFVVLDDNAVITRQGDSDVIGHATVSLIPLLENRVIKERLVVRKGTQTVGQIDVKIFWHQQEHEEKVSNKQIISNLQAFKEDIKKFMTTYRISPEKVFQDIDDNRTGMISFEQFFKWAQKVDPKIGYEVVNQYYKQFKNPVNLTNFTARLQNDKNPQLQKTSQIAKQLSEINKLVSENTMMIKRKQSLEEYLKDKQIDSVFLDIDKSMDGRISKKQLQNFLEAHNVQMPKDQFKNGQKQISIIKFIKKYQSLT